ncbi:HU family DNA-binding protein [Shouchella clausii]|uniref:HU family DNA-binding protein n=1 Tax=Shouchella clausii TaxID=79880 RepID=UPI002DBD3541|nr:HU family DNA-binding protein [Shouchella clausii]MEB5480812.1 HU family DNA-binding protein [Shouchella clausii]
MNKTELAVRAGELLAESTGLKVTKSGNGLTGLKAVEAVTKALTEGLLAEGKVSIPELGTFSVKERAARVGRNPSTGEAMEIPASKAAKFKPGEALKKAVKSL